MSAAEVHPSLARRRVAEALRSATEHFPDLSRIDLNVAGLDGRDRGLALAIHRTVLQRWLTLVHLLNRHLRRPLAETEPALQAVLLSAAAQIVFMDRLPPHAVVNDAVELARRLVRPGAAGLTNAVLRKLVGDVAAIERGSLWTPGRDRLPVDDGWIRLAGPLLPPVDAVLQHLEVATSVPRQLLQHWREAFGLERMQKLALHATRLPPTIVAVEPGFTCDEQCHPHAGEGFVVWDGSREALIEMLAKHPARRVQDPGSAAPVAATAGLDIRCVVDYCAGRGTKTRQVALLHPEARIIATDIDPARFADLSKAFAGWPNVSVVAPDDLAGACGNEKADLLMLDVPCSNTAVFARRPEARYRWSDRNTEELVALQRRIALNALPLVGRGYILYSTCSLDPRENHEQVRWLAEHTRGTIVAEQVTWPEGVGSTYQDGSFYALIRIDGR